MKNLTLCIIAGCLLFGCQAGDQRDTATQLQPADTVISDTIQYHPVRIDRQGNILPWFSANLGQSYDTVLSLVWNFWKHMELDSNGVKYYMNHQVWKPEHDMRGIGGDQISMALSSWRLYYAYTGDESLVENMRYMADYYLEHGLSDSTDAWPDIPYPYNTEVHSGIYDGDMRDGKGITQPDKAGSFGHELVRLYRITGDEKYLHAAGRIADCLAGHTRQGNSTRSPLPFRVNARTGETGHLYNNNQSGTVIESAGYTTNWTGTLMLFEEMEKMDPERSTTYRNAYHIILEWMKTYPLRNNKWGPFFEDIPGWSDTQTNATTFAMFIMQHRDKFPDWQDDVKGIIKWAHAELGNNEYAKYHVEVMNEQTVYRVPGNSHTSRQSSVELMYTALTGDSTYYQNAIRALNWATYTVDHDGKNRYIRDDIWLTDGYGDYVRHYLRAMAAAPVLAPDNENHLLCASSTVTDISYDRDGILVHTFGPADEITFRLVRKPRRIIVSGSRLETDHSEWTPLDSGGVLRLHDLPGTEIRIGT
jgi:hypothetical protein